MAVSQCLARASLVRNATSTQGRVAPKAIGMKSVAPKRASTIVRKAGEEEMKDEFDMSAIGLDDLMNLTDSAEMASRAEWLPGSYAPAHLDGTMPGDFGFDPLNLGKNPEMLAKFREAELLNARWAMLGVAGALAVELLGYGNWVDAPLTMVNGGDATWFGLNLGPATFQNTLAVELLLMGIAEGYRAKETDPEKKMYPGGAFDPMGLSKGDIESLKLKEIKNGRLAMVAMFGFYMQASVTHTGPVANWTAHIADPWNVNVATSNSVAIPYMHLSDGGADFWAAAVPSWYPGL